MSVVGALVNVGTVPRGPKAQLVQHAQLAAVETVPRIIRSPLPLIGRTYMSG